MLPAACLVCSAKTLAVSATSGTVVVADNVKFPGAPEYRAYLKAQEGKSWRTVEHDTHVEYQSLLKDLVLESQYLGEAA